MQPYNGGNDPQRGGVYSTGHGFYNPYAEPEWKREKKRIRAAGNGIGLASVGYVAVSFGAALFLYAVIGAASALRGGNFMEVGENAQWSVTLITYILSLIVPFGIYALCIQMPIGAAFPFRKMRGDITVGGIFVGLGAGIVASYATSYLEQALGLFGIGISMPEFEIPTALSAKIIYIITMTVAPAFIEEMVFRGIVMQSLRRFGDMFALVSSALIFGIFHLNLIQTPYAFILGLCIGYFVMRTGSLWVGVIMHFLNNSIATVLTLAEPYCSEEMFLFINLAYSLAAVMCGIIALCLLLVKYRDMFRFGDAPGVLSSGKRAAYFLTSPALLIAMLTAVVLTAQYIEIL